MRAKIAPDHLERTALVYVRQSMAGQVQARSETDRVRLLRALPGISHSRAAFSRSCVCNRRGPGRQMQQIGDQAVAKQHDGLVV
jgi:hypothetical protein